MSVSTAQHLLDILLGLLPLLFFLLILAVAHFFFHFFSVPFSKKTFRISLSVFIADILILSFDKTYPTFVVYFSGLTFIISLCILWIHFVLLLAKLSSFLKAFFLSRLPVRRRSDLLCKRIFLFFPQLCNDSAFAPLRALCPNDNLLFAMFALSVVCMANTFSKRLSLELYIDVNAYLLTNRMQSRSELFHERFIEICNFNSLGEIQTLDGFSGWLDISLEDCFVSQSRRQSIIVPLLRYAAFVFPDPSKIRLHGSLDFS